MFKSSPIKLIEMSTNAKDPSAVSRGNGSGISNVFFLEVTLKKRQQMVEKQGGL
jgi:hypothetical protein